MGVHLVNLLSEQSYIHITVTSRSKRISAKENVSYVQGNGHDMTFISALLTEKFDVIVDFMNYSTNEFKERYQSLLASCEQYIYLSSSRVYANSDHPITENSPRLLDTMEDTEYLSSDEYSLAKARQENLLLDSAHTNWTIIRPYITYSENRLQLGVFEKESWLYRAIHGRTIVFSKDIASKMTTLSYGFDVARGIVAIIGRKDALGQIFHITSTESIQWQTVLEIYSDVLEQRIGKRPKVLITEESPNLQSSQGKYQVKYDRLFNRVFDSKKINQFVDTCEFIKPHQGLRVCLERFMDHPHFSRIDYGTEAKNDKLAGEYTPLNEIDSLKHKIKYILYRYIL